MRQESVVVPKEQVVETFKTVMQKELQKQFKGFKVEIKTIEWLDEGLKFVFTVP